MRSHRFKLAAVFCALVSLTACNSEIDKMVAEQNQQKSTDKGDGHDHGTIKSNGRLVITDKDNAAVSVFELDDNQLLETFNTTNVVSGLYASPGLRYGVLVQRNHDLVEFVDGGLYQENHGDHLHPYQVEPNLSSFQISAAKPTHFDVTEERAALFLDGNDELNIPAGFIVLDDEGIEQGSQLASHTLERAMHGTAQLRDDIVLATYRSEAATNVLPDFVDVFHQHDDHFHQEQRIEPNCPGLHGSAQNHDSIAFGCTDGVLVVTQAGETFTASKIGNLESMPEGARIGSLKATHGSDLYIANAKRNYFYLIDSNALTMSEINWRDDESITVVAYNFSDAHGFMAVLDSQGFINIFEESSQWQVSARFKVTDEINGTYTLTTSSASDTVYIAAQETKQVIAVDLEQQSAQTILTLDFVPNKLIWLGIPEEHDH
ncbi:hypothetical protein PULV_a3700 [Pseudoalteromonas ulvae UL12]|uniref:hypothetical protein n=1 Tax=Pseudoalteromonas ulvae TaxID=107327 RepID=UPI00186B646B|nr:hypothetical protein [Pseudoalteromonas ulvae]MBE0362021.1 hypothetical protein [Pseudoalteromonas ulvae UL12]